MSSVTRCPSSLRQPPNWKSQASSCPRASPIWAAPIWLTGNSWTLRVAVAHRTFGSLAGPRELPRFGMYTSRPPSARRLSPPRTLALRRFLRPQRRRNADIRTRGARLRLSVPLAAPWSSRRAGVGGPLPSAGSSRGSRLSPATSGEPPAAFLVRSASLLHSASSLPYIGKTRVQS